MTVLRLFRFNPCKTRYDRFPNSSGQKSLNNFPLTPTVVLLHISPKPVKKGAARKFSGLIKNRFPAARIVCRARLSAYRSNSAKEVISVHIIFSIRHETHCAVITRTGARGKRCPLEQPAKHASGRVGAPPGSAVTRSLLRNSIECPRADSRGGSFAIMKYGGRAGIVDCLGFCERRAGSGSGAGVVLVRAILARSCVVGKRF